MRAKIINHALCENTELHSSIELAAQAARDCIAAAGIDVNEIDYLINTGVYRDHNMVEPSMAALIQKRIGLNPDFTRFPVDSTAFSCDVINGVNGVINACQLAQAIFTNQKAKYVLVVSSDAHPSREKREDLPFAPCGAALLLAPGADEGQGFSHFNLNAGNLGSPSAPGEIGRLDMPGAGTEGRNTISIERDANFLNQLQDLLITAGQSFIRKNDLDVTKTALIVPALAPSFCQSVGEPLGFANGNIIDTWPQHGYTHSSSFACGFADAAAKGDSGITHVLYIGAGAGLSAVCAVYQL